MNIQEKPAKKYSIRPHHKVRTGCVTCRRRRVKCDESKPICMRCQRSRHDCAGYNTPVAWIFDPFTDLDRDGPSDKANPHHRSTDQQQQSLTIIEFERPQINNTITSQVQTLRQPWSSTSSDSSARAPSHPSTRSVPRPASSSNSTNTTSPTIPQSLPHLLKWTPEEGSRFQYYMAICRTTLEAAFESDVELFCTILPQASHRVPAIRSALVCFASYTASLAETDPIRRQSHRQVAERQYVKVLHSAASIGGSRRSDSDWLEVFLVALLLRCLETYRHDYVRAKTHLVGSARIVTEKGRIGHFQNPTLAIENSIKHIISRVDAKVRLDAVQPDLAKSSPLSPFLVFSSVVSRICKRLKAFREGVDDGDGDGDGDTTNKRKVIHQCVDELDNYFIYFQNITKSPDDKILGQTQPSSSSIYLQVQYEICRLVLIELADGSHGTRQPPPSTSTSTSSTVTSSPHQPILDLITQFAHLQHPHPQPHQYSHQDPTSQKTVHYHGKRRLYLGFGVELITSVLFIATESPDRATRRAAISFLKSSYRQEWLWDSFNATRVAEWLTSEDVADDGIDGTRQGSVDDEAEDEGDVEGDENSTDADVSIDNDHHRSSSHSHPSPSSSQPQSQPRHYHHYHPISATFHVPHTTTTTSSSSSSSSSTTPESPFHRATWIQLELRTTPSGNGNTDTSTTTHWLNSDENTSKGQVKNLEPPYPSFPRYSVPGPFWPSAAQAVWNSFHGSGGGQ